MARKTPISHPNLTHTKQKGNVSVKDSELIKVVESAIEWMKSSPDNIFYTEYLKNNLPFSLRQFQNRINDNPNSVLENKFAELKEWQEIKYLKHGMSAKNPVFMIFLLCNHYKDKYRRQDSPVEVREEKTDAVIFKFAQPKQEE